MEEEKKYTIMKQKINIANNENEEGCNGAA